MKKSNEQLMQCVYNALKSDIIINVCIQHDLKMLCAFVGLKITMFRNFYVDCLIDITIILFLLKI